MSQQRDNSGALFRNDRKEKDTHPDYSGPCMVEGKPMRIAAWIKRDKQNRQYLSLDFSEPRPATNDGPATSNRESEDPGAGLDDDLPF